MEAIKKSTINKFGVQNIKQFTAAMNEPYTYLSNSSSGAGEFNQPRTAYDPSSNIDDPDATLRTTTGRANWITEQAINNPAAAGYGPFVAMEEVTYLDQVLPFDIEVNFANEYGQMAYFTIYKAEILNEGFGISVDDMVLESACTFIALGMDRIQPGSRFAGKSTQSNIAQAPTRLGGGIA
jgi:hypothetical protein